MTSTNQAAIGDPFLFDQEGLAALTDSDTLRQGLACFKDCRVFEIDQQGDVLRARVEDGEDGLPVTVEIRLAEDGHLHCACECSAGQTTLCLHQAAVLYAYADQCGETNQLLTASDAAIRDRVKRGRTEVRVESLDGFPWFGDWLASSLSTISHYPRQYRVSIRSLHRRANLCTCPDFAVNQLGTCKHIEAVLHKIAKHPDYEEFRRQPAPLSYVYLAWDVPDAPRVRLHRARTLEAGLAGVLDEYFDAVGTFRGHLPDGFFRLQDTVGDRDDIRFGEDAVEYVRQMVTAAARRQRAEEIRALIRAAAGRLPGVRARLYPYQVEGAAFLAGTGRALLADDMGLGKTLQAIAAAAWLREHEGVRRILVVCPASLKQQWAREIDKFTGLASQIIQGTPPERTAQYRREAVFFLVNYELVLRDLSLLRDSLRPDLIIMDEAQRIKNWRTKIAAAIKHLPCRHAFVLTGTPLENRLEDLYSLMQVVDANILGPLWRYLVDFHITDERGKVLGYRNLALLRQRIAPVMLRRDRSLVREQLPDRIVQRLDVGMTEKQRELHDAALSNAGSLAAVARRRPLTPTEQHRLMAALQQSRMACNAAGLVDKESEGSPKLDELVALLDELCLQSGLKAVVFSQWELMTRMVETRLTAMGLGCVRLHGGVPTAHRGALMDRFR
ncbi:MAG: helicase, partial [Desulfobulbaceae bacterium A2]